MTRMKKSIKIEKFLIITLIILLSISLTNLITSNDKINKYSYTKAICDDKNHCKDYYIECDDRKLTKLTLTGLTIQKDSNWEDPRPKSNLCS